MKFNNDEKWLKEKAEKEDGCLVSVGGLVCDIMDAEKDPSPPSTVGERISEDRKWSTNATEMKPLEPEFSKVVDKHFWDLTMGGNEERIAEEVTPDTRIGTEGSLKNCKDAGSNPARAKIDLNEILISYKDEGYIDVCYHERVIEIITQQREQIRELSKPKNLDEWLFESQENLIEDQRQQIAELKAECLPFLKHLNVSSGVDSLGKEQRLDLADLITKLGRGI